MHLDNKEEYGTKSVRHHKLWNRKCLNEIMDERMQSRKTKY